MNREKGDRCKRCSMWDVVDADIHMLTHIWFIFFAHILSKVDAHPFK